MSNPNALYPIFLLILGVCALGCSAAPTSDSCMVTGVQDLLPSKNISDYQMTDRSDNLGSEFYQIVLDNDSVLFSKI